MLELQSVDEWFAVLRLLNQSVAVNGLGFIAMGGGIGHLLRPDWAELLSSTSI